MTRAVQGEELAGYVRRKFPDAVTGLRGRFFVG